MSEQRAGSGERRPASINRRVFVVTVASGVAGLALDPSAAQASPVFGAAGRLANAVGAMPAGEEIDDYIKSPKVSKSTALEVMKINCTARRDNFSDSSGSNVYFLKPEKTYFFYTLRHSDHFNAVAHFFDISKESDPQFLGTLAGPTLFGIAEVAHSVARKWSVQVVRRSILPRGVIRSNGLSMQRSYDLPDEYETDEGVVRARYTTNGRGRGTVTIEVKNKAGTLLAGGDYDLSYRAAD